MSLEQLLRELNDYIYKNYNHAKATGMIALKVGDKISVAHWGDVGFCFYTETFFGMPTLYPVEPGLWGGKYFKLMDEFIAKLSNMMEGKIPDDLRTELEDLRRRWYVESFGVKYKEKLYPAIGNEDSNDFIKKVRFLEVDFPDCAIMGWSDGLELLARFYETQAINLALTIKRNLSQKQNLINWLVTSSAYFQERKLYSLNSEVRKKSDDMAFATIGTQNRLVGNAYERNECQIYDPIRILECYSDDEVLRFGTISELVGRFDNELTEILEKYVGQALIARMVEEGFLPPR